VNSYRKKCYTLETRPGCILHRLS